MKVYVIWNSWPFVVAVLAPHKKTYLFSSSQPFKICDLDTQGVDFDYASMPFRHQFSINVLDRPTRIERKTLLLAAKNNENSLSETRYWTSSFSLYVGLSKKSVTVETPSKFQWVRKCHPASTTWRKEIKESTQGMDVSRSWKQLASKRPPRRFCDSCFHRCWCFVLPIVVNVIIA